MVHIEVPRATPVPNNSKTLNVDFLLIKIQNKAPDMTSIVIKRQSDNESIIDTSRLNRDAKIKNKTTSHEKKRSLINCRSCRSLIVVLWLSVM